MDAQRYGSYRQGQTALYRHSAVLMLQNRYAAKSGCDRLGVLAVVKPKPALFDAQAMNHYDTRGICLSEGQVRPCLALAMSTSAQNICLATGGAMIFAGVAAVCAFGFYKVGQANIEKRFGSWAFSGIC